MKDPEKMHAIIASGDAGRIHSHGSHLYGAAQAVDEARDSIIEGGRIPAWQGLAGLTYRSQAQGMFVAAGGGSWGLYRTGDFLLAAAQAYEVVVDDADRLIEWWRKFLKQPGSEDPEADKQQQNAMQLLVVTLMEANQKRWETWLSDSAGTLDDDGGAEFGEWFEGGQAKDFNYMWNTGAQRGFRIPKSLFNGDDDGWTQQGLAHTKGTFLVTSYRDHDNQTGDGEDGPDDSMISLVDDKTGEPLNNVELLDQDGTGAPSHSGGVAVSGDDVYVVGGGTLYRYSLKDLRNADPGEPVKALGQSSVPASSYVTINGGDLYLGNHGEEELVRYDLDDVPDLERGSSSVDYDTYEAPPSSNGVIVNDDGSFTFSENNGRDADSRLRTYPPYSPGDDLPGDDQVTNYDYPNLGEEVVVVDGKVMTMSEAGADAYSWRDSDDDGEGDSGSEGKDLWGQGHSFVLPADGVRGGEVDVTYVDLDQAAKNLLVAQAKLESAAQQISQLTLPPRVLAEVPPAPLFAKSVDRYVDDVARHLATGVEASGHTADNLWDVSEGYESADSGNGSVFDQISDYLSWAGGGPEGPAPAP